jgi:hypothetical protein
MSTLLLRHALVGRDDEWCCRAHRRPCRPTGPRFASVYDKLSADASRGDQEAADQSGGSGVYMLRLGEEAAT